MSSHVSLFLSRLCFLFVYQGIKVCIYFETEIFYKTEVTICTHLYIHIHCYLIVGCSTFLPAATYLLNTKDMFVKQVLILIFALEQFFTHSNKTFQNLWETIFKLPDGFRPILLTSILVHLVSLFFFFDTPQVPEIKLVLLEIRRWYWKCSRNMNECLQFHHGGQRQKGHFSKMTIDFCTHIR